ncbi:hypothetical protein OTU49_001214 [Cherax quadricarinatus]|uniref:WH2 domain-containing protein n=1 Tax=Cherax quadricarinatus TaxID=27406 RepID=A0AAW0XWL6_CHEQU
MPPPPPPPPAPGGGFQRRGQPLPKAGGGGDDRSALLSAIRSGTKLKKSVTNDRSAPIIDGKPSTNGGGNRGGGGGGGGGGGRMMMNGGAPQLGHIADGVNRLRPTGRLPANPSNRSGPLLPPGRKPSPSVPVRDVSLESQHTAENNSVPPSPKPSSKSNPAPPPPPATSKPSFPNDRLTRGPLPVPPNPANKPAPPRPPVEELPTSVPSESGYHPALPSKPVLINKPSVGNKPAPPRPPTGSKPTLPPKMPILQPNGSTPPSSKPASRTNSMRECRIPSEPEFHIQNNSCPGEDSLLPSRTLPLSHNHRNIQSGLSANHGSIRPNTVGHRMGANIARSMTRPPSERPPPPPNRPSVPPPSQPPPPPPPSRPVPVPSASLKPEVVILRANFISALLNTSHYQSYTRTAPRPTLARMVREAVDLVNNLLKLRHTLYPHLKYYIHPYPYFLHKCIPGPLFLLIFLLVVIFVILVILMNIS